MSSLKCDIRKARRDVLLNNLEPDRELHTARNVKTAVMEAEEHGDVRVALGVLLLESDIRYNVLVLPLRLWSLNGAIVGA